MKKRFLIIISLFVTAFSSVTFAISKKDVQTLVEKHQYEEAIEALQSLMKQPAFAKDGDCNKLLGQSLCMIGRYSEAVNPLEVAIKQNRRSGALWYQAIVRQHLYDFEGALESIEAYRPVLKSDLWNERADSLEAECQQGLRALNHIQDVEIIDSMLVDKSTFFCHYNLGFDSGRLLHDDQEGVFFESQSADYRIFANDNKLYESYKIRDNWEEKHLINGVGSDDFKVIMPFMRTDGETLYFACDSTPGMGGLDIYKTRFNTEEKSFYQPERLGMPFNSPFDDYMMAIDETHQVGWWATERRGYPEEVLIYLFKLSEDPEYLEEPSVERARIDCIADSWKQDGGYEELVSAILDAGKVKKKEGALRIVIDDQRVYDSVDRFKNPRAKSLYEQSMQTKRQIAENEGRIESLRKDFVSASQSQRQSISSQIRRLEEELGKYYRDLSSKEKEYRRLELE